MRDKKKKEERKGDQKARKGKGYDARRKRGLEIYKKKMKERQRRKKEKEDREKEKGRDKLIFSVPITIPAYFFASQFYVGSAYFPIPIIIPTCFLSPTQH